MYTFLLVLVLLFGVSPVAGGVTIYLNGQKAHELAPYLEELKDNFQYLQEEEKYFFSAPAREIYVRGRTEDNGIIVQEPGGRAKILTQEILIFFRGQPVQADDVFAGQPGVLCRQESGDIHILFLFPGRMVLGEILQIDRQNQAILLGREAKYSYQQQWYILSPAAWEEVQSRCRVGDFVQLVLGEKELQAAWVYLYSQ